MVIFKSDRAGYGLGPSSGKSLRCSFVKTDLANPDLFYDRQENAQSDLGWSIGNKQI